jgi:hypothetical protein
VRRLRQMRYAYQIQAAQTMYYRAKYHANQTAGMRAAMRIWRRFLQTTRRQRRTRQPYN